MGDVPGWAKNEDGSEMKGSRDELPLAAEVVSRRKPKKQSKEEVQKEKDEFVTLEWIEIFSYKPYDRLRWLDKALRAAQAGRLKALPVFDVITHRKFLEGLKGSIATDCLNLIRGSLDIFSAKQKKQLTSDNFELFRKYAPISVIDSDEDEADAPPLPPPPKVIIEEKTKKKRNKGGAANATGKKEEDSDGDSNDELETKRAKIMNKGIERRVDPADGQAYTLAEFVAEYGGSVDRPPDLWHKQQRTSFIFKE